MFMFKRKSLSSLYLLPKIPGAEPYIENTPFLPSLLAYIPSEGSLTALHMLETVQYLIFFGSMKPTTAPLWFPACTCVEQGAMAPTMCLGPVGAGKGRAQVPGSARPFSILASAALAQLPRLRGMDTCQSQHLLCGGSEIIEQRRPQERL